MNRKYFLRGFLMGVILFLVGVGFKAKKLFVQPNIALNEIEFLDLDSKAIDIDQLKGKPIVLNFWATWCKPCIREFPSFEVVKNEFPEVHILTVSDEPADRVTAFSEQMPFTFRYLLSSKNLEEYGITARPTTYFYDAEGALVDKHIGGLTPEKLRKLIREIQ